MDADTGEGGRGMLGSGNLGMPATASGGSPGSWGLAAAFKPRATPHPTSNGRPPASDPDGVGLPAVMWRFRSRSIEGSSAGSAEPEGVS